MPALWAASATGFMPRGKTHRIGVGVADCPGPAVGLLRTGVPTRVDPPGVDRQAVQGDVADCPKHVLLGRLLEPYGRVRGRGTGSVQRFAAGGRGVVPGQEPPQQVLAPHRVLARPEEQEDRRRADLLARMKPQVGPLHAGLDLDRAIAGAGQRRRPLAGPSDPHGHAAAARIGQVPKRQGPVGRAAAERRQADGLAGGDRLLQRPKIGDLGVAAFRIAEAEITLGRRVPEFRREGLDVFQDRRVPNAGIGEVQHPLHGRKIAIECGRAAYDQPRFGIAEGKHALAAVFVQRPLLLPTFPQSEEFSRRLPTVDERKRQPGRRGTVQRCHGPRPRRLHLAGKRRGGGRERGCEESRYDSDGQPKLVAVAKVPSTACPAA